MHIVESIARVLIVGLMLEQDCPRSSRSAYACTPSVWATSTPMAR